MKRHSIANRVVWLVLAVELLAALAVTTFAFFYERHAHFRSFDVALRGRADTVMGAVEDADDRDLGVMLDTTDLRLPEHDVYAVREEGLKELGRSPEWSPDAEAWNGPAVFFSLRVHGHAYRGLRLRGVRVVDPMSANVRHPITVLYASPVEKVWGAVVGAVQVFALANGLLVLVTALLVPAMVRRGLEPLRALAEDAGGIAVGAWGFSPGEDVRGVAELRPLVGALEGLIVRLERSFTQQRQFVGDAAHELKTGVAVVKSSIQLLELRARTAEEYKAGLRRCYADCLRMEELALQMLLLARVEEMPAASTGGETELSEAVSAAVEDLGPLAALQGVRLVPEGIAEGRVVIEPELLRSLMVNLLTNAIQHSAAGASVRIAARRNGREIQMEVEDTGEGIAPELVPFVFDRFYRGDPSRSRKTGGTGLGLAICKAIVERAGGRIGLVSEANAGTRVWLRLPLAGAATAQEGRAVEVLESGRPDTSPGLPVEAG